MADVAFHSDEEINTSGVNLEGDITVPGAPQEHEEELSTLDEPVKDTFVRDLKAVGVKFFHVLYPKENRILLRDWDLWGPLVLCIFMAMTLQKSGLNSMDKSEGGVQFAQVFLIYWLGAGVISLNIKLLGGNISLFQGMCVLGYCVAPLAAALIVCSIILTTHQTLVMIIIRIIVVLLAFGWSTFGNYGYVREAMMSKAFHGSGASTAFLADCQPPHRKALAVYPIFLFYFVISWLVLSHTHGT